MAPLPSVQVITNTGLRTGDLEGRVRRANPLYTTEILGSSGSSLLPIFPRICLRIHWKDSS